MCNYLEIAQKTDVRCLQPLCIGFVLKRNNKKIYITDGVQKNIYILFFHSYMICYGFSQLHFQFLIENSKKKNPSYSDLPKTTVLLAI